MCQVCSSPTSVACQLLALHTPLPPLLAFPNTTYCMPSPTVHCTAHHPTKPPTPPRPHAPSPRRLHSALARFVCTTLGIRSLAPPPSSVAHLLDSEGSSEVPLLFIITPGADPTPELAECAAQRVGRDKYHEVAMGQGQAEVALQLLRDCARSGGWTEGCCSRACTSCQHACWGMACATLPGAVLPGCLPQLRRTGIFALASSLLAAQCT